MRYVICLLIQLIANAIVARATMRELIAFDNHCAMNGAVFVVNYAVTGYGSTRVGSDEGARKVRY